MYARIGWALACLCACRQKDINFYTFGSSKAIIKSACQLKFCARKESLKFQKCLPFEYILPKSSFRVVERRNGCCWVAIQRHHLTDCISFNNSWLLCMSVDSLHVKLYWSLRISTHLLGKIARFNASSAAIIGK